MTDWDPSRYERYRDEREKPLFDLIELAESRLSCGDPAVVDLGAGTARGTLALHRLLHARRTVAVDSSEAMVAEARVHVGEEIEVLHQGIEAFVADPAQHGGFDLVFSNAALHWLADHEALLAKLRQLLRPGGVVAVQMPANEHHASHVVARQLAGRPPFAAALRGWTRQSPVRAPSWYAQALHALDFEDMRVELRVYPQVVPGVPGVVSWVRGSLLTAYQARLPADLYEAFLAQYAVALGAELGVDPDAPAPLFYPYDRLFFAGRRR